MTARSVASPIPVTGPQIKEKATFIRLSFDCCKPELRITVRLHATATARLCAAPNMASRKSTWESAFDALQQKQPALAKGASSQDARPCHTLFEYLRPRHRVDVMVQGRLSLLKLLHRTLCLAAHPIPAS